VHHPSRPLFSAVNRRRARDARLYAISSHPEPNPSGGHAGTTMRATMQAAMLLVLAASAVATHDGCCVAFYGEPATTSAGADVCDLCPLTTATGPWNETLTCRDSFQPENGGIRVDTTKKDCITWDYATNDTSGEISCGPENFQFFDGSHPACMYPYLPNHWTLQGTTDTSELYAPVPDDTEYYASLFLTLPVTMAKFDSSMHSKVVDALSIATKMDTAFYGITQIVAITPGPPKEYGADRTPDTVHVHVRIATTNEAVIIEAQDELGSTYAEISQSVETAVLAAIDVSPVFPFKMVRWSRWPPEEVPEEEEEK